MAEAFFGLSAADRAEALGVAAANSGRPAFILEKDVWVVWSLSTLFESQFGAKLVFKGGTSLSKVYKAIGRFSEDIDVTYDIRAFAPDLVQDAGEEALPPTNSQQGKWTKEIKKRLPIWVSDSADPLFRVSLEKAGLNAKVIAEGDSLFLEYEPIAGGYGYVAPRIKIEFGARATGEPADVHQVECDAAPFLTELLFPNAAPRVMRVERTFWEKATAIHVFCYQCDIKDRLARHWSDIASLARTGLTAGAIANREIAAAVARYKQWFFSEKDTAGNKIDYSAAVSGSLKLVPEGATLQALAADYAKMIEDGLFLDDPVSFETVIEICRDIQDQANALAADKPPQDK